MSENGPPIADETRAEALDWLLRLREAPADERLRTEFEAWLAADPRHAQAYRQAQRTWALSGQVARPPTRARQTHAARRPRRKAYWLVPAALAASLAILAFGPRLSILVQADYRTGVGETQTVTLADGSTVTLNTATALSAAYTASRREIRLLAGEAFFDIERDPDRPFSVRAGDQTVTVVGTAFNVRLDDKRLSVAVASGRVQVGEESAGATLGAGDRWLLDRASGEVAVQRVATDRIARWRNGRLAVAGATVAEVVAELDRYQPGRVWIVDDELAGRRITGSFNLNTPEAALHAAVEPHGGRVRSITPYLLLLTAK